MAITGVMAIRSAIGAATPSLRAPLDPCPPCLRRFPLPR